MRRLNSINIIMFYSFGRRSLTEFSPCNSKTKGALYPRNCSDWSQQYLGGPVDFNFQWARVKQKFAQQILVGLSSNLLVHLRSLFLFLVISSASSLRRERLSVLPLMSSHWPPFRFQCLDSGSFQSCYWPVSWSGIAWICQRTTRRCRNSLFLQGQRWRIWRQSTSHKMRGWISWRPCLWEYGDRVGFWLWIASRYSKNKLLTFHLASIEKYRLDAHFPVPSNSVLLINRGSQWKISIKIIIPTSINQFPNLTLFIYYSQIHSYIWI